MQQKPYSSKSLDDIRQRIDALDNRIHDALMERAELVLKIGEEKRKNNIQIVQPAREARMIRRLLSRHKGVLPQKAVVRIWRELVGAVSLLQTGLNVTVSMEQGQEHLWDMARDYFGSCLPFQKSGSPLSAVAAVRNGRATFAVVPFPQESEDQPWWENLFEQSPTPLRVIIRLPHGEDRDANLQEPAALVVARSGFDDSGEDCSFLLVQCSSSISRARIVDAARAAGFDPKNLSSKRATGDKIPCLHFMEVGGFASTDDLRLSEMSAALGQGAAVTVGGGYPVPPVYKVQSSKKVPASPTGTQKGKA